MNQQKDDPVAAVLESFLNAFSPGPVGMKAAGLSECRGRVLATDIKAEIDSPPFSRALVEGFLVNAVDTEGVEEKKTRTLTIAGVISPGKTYEGPLQAGSCVEVSTGSFVPEGAYAVARYMDIVRNDRWIIVKRQYDIGENIEIRGCEIKKGDIILERGIRLSHKEIMTLAGQGILSVNVVRKPKVTIFCSGNEVIPPSEPLEPGYIWDANSYTLAAQVDEYGGEPIFCGIMKDDFSAFKNALLDRLSSSDMVVISGGTAVGGKEFVVELINAIGKPGVLVNGVPMRSGKPLIMGVVENKPIVCVAGYPPESMRGFEMFGKPVIERLLGQK